MITIKTAYKHAALRALSGGSGTEVKTASGDVASFDDAIAAPLQSLTYSIWPSQSGSGVPSPDNIRIINGIDTLDIVNKNHIFYPTETQTKTITFPKTVYRGEGNAAGVFSNKFGIVDLGDLTWTTSGNRAYCSELATVIKKPTSPTEAQNSIAEQIKVVNYGASLQANQMTVYSDGRLIAYYDGATPEGKFCYELATPETLQVTPVSMNAFAGSNNIYADIPISLVSVEYLAKTASKKDKIIPYLPLIYGRKELL